MNTPIKTFSLEELASVVSQIGLPSFRSKQIASWLYDKGVSSYDEMTNLPLAMRNQLAEAFPLHSPKLETRLVSKDKSRKYLLFYHDGASAETVAIPHADGRLTVCISSQAGCSMKCDFCATGKAGLTRNLYPGEIVDQVLMVKKDFDARITNVVVMGQGEPFANYDNCINALKILNDKKLLAIGARHITVSTCGLIKGIHKFASEPEQYTLAVSLHSAIQKTRDSIMPGLKSQSLISLKSALNSYIEKTNRRVSFEYALMNEINDSEDHLKALVQYTQGMLCHINLIPLNRIDDSFYQPSKDKVLRHWQTILESHHISATIRHSRGSDIDGACGQLANKKI